MFSEKDEDFIESLQLNMRDQTHASIERKETKIT
jgi:hypothetical protein